MGIRHRTCANITLGLPLMCAARALGQLPLVLEEVLEEVVAPLRRRAGPGDFQPARDGIAGNAGCIGARPSETLLFDCRTFRLCANVRRRGSCPMRLAEGVSAGD